jgi:hypothetical protein
MSQQNETNSKTVKSLAEEPPKESAKPVLPQ